jgi:hypothetical protein
MVQKGKGYIDLETGEEIGNATEDAGIKIPKVRTPSVDVRQWIRYEPETDIKTRKDNRSGVKMFPAHKAIINVYQLVERKDKFKEDTKKNKKGSVKRTKQSGNGAKQSNRGEKIYPSMVVTGRYVDKYGDIVRYESETDKQYADINLLQHQRMEELKQKQEAETIKKTIEYAESIKKAQSMSNKGNPDSEVNRLRKILKEKRIPIVSKISDIRPISDYSERSLDEESGDIGRIYRALDNTEERRKNELPPPMYALVSSKNPNLITTVYVKNNVQNRKRKLIRVKAKRPIVHGNKRRVVMKKKGGKR